MTFEIIRKGWRTACGRFAFRHCQDNDNYGVKHERELFEAQVGSFDTGIHLDVTLTHWYPSGRSRVMDGNCVLNAEQARELAGALLEFADKQEEAA